MKKILFILFLIIETTAVYTQTLDSIIDNAANEISNILAEKTTVAVINFQSTSTRLTDYVIEEINGKIANIGRIIPVSRRQLDGIRMELDFNMSGEVSDESAQRIGHMLGSEYIIIGSIESIGQHYRIRFQAITVETASIVYSFSANVQMDSTLQALYEGSNVTVDFTSAERWRGSALNLLFGMGSFQMNDKTGGIIAAIVEGLGIASVVVGIFNSDMYSNLGTPNYNLLSGIAIYFGGAVYGVIRAQTYHKTGAYVSLIPVDGLQLNLVSLENKDIGIQFGYNWEF